MMKTRILSVWILLILMSLACSRSGRQADKSEYAPYITGFTSGVISKKEPVRIRLAAGQVAFETGKEVPAEVFRFHPPVKGKAVMFSGGVVEFRPETAWPSGSEIGAEFDLAKFMEVPKQLGVFHFEFRTITPAIGVRPGKLVFFTSQGKRMGRYEGSLASADHLELVEAEQLVEAFYDGRRMPVRWDFGSAANTFDFVVDSLPRPEKTGVLDISWDGKPLKIEGKGNLSLEIPAAGDFVFLGASILQGEDQCVEAILSDPPDPAQDLSGLVYLQEGDPVRLVSENNVIRIYPVSPISGERTLVIESSLRNDLCNNLKSRISEKISFEDLKPAAEFIGQGVIMPDPEGLSLPFRAVGLRAVDVCVYKIFENNIPYFLQQNEFTTQYLYNFRQYGRPVWARTILLDDDPSRDLSRWNSYAIDLSPLVKEDPGAAYRVKLSFRKAYAVNRCGVAPEDLGPYLLTGTVPERQLRSYEGEGWYDEDEWPEDYSWMQRDNPCHDSYYISERFPQKIVLSSTIGVMAKSSDGLNFGVFTTDLMTAAPLEKVLVSFFNYQNQPIGEVTTGAGGMAEASLDARPFFLRAVYGPQQTWMRLDDGTSLSLSRFDVGGAVVQQGLKGMIYGERGVWRPGDTLFLTFILDDRENPLPEGHPVSLELFNARGQKAYFNRNLPGTDGFYTARIDTDPDAPTGSWRAIVRAGGATFERSLRIETVKPNRLKIKLDFNQEILQTFSGKPEAALEVSWLHGAPAPGINASVDLSFRKSSAVFPGFESYTFHNPAGYFWADERNILEQALDQQGKAVFSPALPDGGNAPGMMDAVFLVRAFEKGGDFSTDVFTRRFSPFKNYVGIRVPGGGTWDRMLETDTDQQVDVALVAWNGTPVTQKGLEVKVYKIQWRWWWNAGDDDLAYYTGSQDAEVVYRGTVDVAQGKGSFRFRINYPDWGRYLILVKDPSGGHQSGQTVYFDWPGSVDRSGRPNPAGATMLVFNADKEKYRPGDRAVISFPASEGSRALVTVENGSRVLFSQWKLCRAAEETIELDITREMAPNVYVYLSLVQPHARTDNDAPSRLYGVIPLFVEDPATVLQPVITMPNELKPGESFSIAVKENTGRPMTFTLAVVDEGLLDLTRFATPDPHATFYAREALGVKTWDIYDLVLGAYGGKIEKVLAIGGDQDALLKKDRKAQRFEPVVKFAGPYTLRKGESRELSFTMPNYVGSVRTMVIAGYDGAYGNAERTTPVRKPLMVLATLPRVLGPGEAVDLPVTIFAMMEGIGAVDVRVDINGPVRLVQPSQSLRIDRPGEQMAYFRLNTAQETGMARIRITAEGGGETAVYEVNLEVRNPVPVLSETRSAVAAPGQELILPYAFIGTPGTNNGMITFSGLPDFGLEKHLHYLVSYPYGCLEQVVSAAFAQLYLRRLTDPGPELSERMEQNIREAIQKVDRQALPDGGMTLWPGQTHADSWVTSYAGHFLLLAEQNGCLLPSGLRQRWLDYQYRAAGNFQPTSPDNVAWAPLNQAYRLYTLALGGRPNHSAMNRLRESGRLAASSAWVLASAYIYAGKPEVAQELIAGKAITATDAYDYAGPVYGSPLRDRAFILETLTLLKKDADAFRLLESMAEEMRTGWLSTQSAAFGLHAIALYAGGQTGAGLDFEYTDGPGETRKITTNKPVSTLEFGDQSASGQFRILNKKQDARLFVSLTVSGKPDPSGMRETERTSGIKLSVRYTDDAGNALDVSRIRQGTGFVAEVTVEQTGFSGEIRDLALSQVFPSGWEILNQRMQDVPAGLKEDAFEYRDVRDDRVDTFFDLEGYRKKTFRVRLNAAYSGRYYLPAVSCHAMYDQGIHANTKGQWVEVVR